MSLWHIAWGYIWNRKFTSALTIFSVALGVGLIYSVLTLREETRKRFEEEGQSFDVVVGAKGSELQLVLSSLYFMDRPTGNIKLSDYERIRNEEDVAAAFPISLGDTFRGFRIVGTTRDLFDYTWISPTTGEKRQPFRLAEGRLFEKPLEAVVGSTVARVEDLHVGDSFIGTHGFAELPEGMREDHHEHPYTVVGVLEPSGSPNDRAIFCDLTSVWDVHSHAHEGIVVGSSYGGHEKHQEHPAHAEEGAENHTAQTHGAEHEERKVDPVRHVVLFKFKDGATPEQINTVERDFEALPDKINEIKALEWGTNISPEDLAQGYTHCFFLAFDNEADRDAYLVHPAHKQFASTLGPVLDNVLVVDYTPEEHAGDELEITSVLVALDTPALRFQFVDYVNDEYNALATIPINQITNLYASVLGTAKSVLLSVGYLVVVISAISILIGLYLSILQRRRDLAVMRALGASAYEIVGSVLIEAFIVTVLGVLAGWILGNAASWGIGLYLARHYGLTVDVFGMLTTEEAAAFSVVALVGMLAGIAPAWQAYRTDVARDLAEL